MVQTVWAVAALAIGADGKLADAPPAPPGFPKFQVQQIAADLKIGYAVILEDIDGDTKPDVVVVDQHRVVWYQNPTWQVRTILQGKTKPDNVCIAAIDIDGDKLPELVVGAGWKPSDTKTPGTLQWLRRGKSLDDEWTMHAIPCDEPTVHRVKVIDTDRDGKPEIVMAPLQGREATAKGNWTDGRPVRILSYQVPANPERPEAWKPVVIDEHLHVVHNIAPWPPRAVATGAGVVAASYEGVTGLSRSGDKRFLQRLGDGDQANPAGSRGASEVRVGRLKENRELIGTIEPWHGNRVVAYLQQNGPHQRLVIDTNLRWGHAVSVADLDGDDADELVVGVRDDPNPKMGDTFKERRGVRLYRTADGTGAKWDRYILDDGGVAVEDLAVGDLDSDGKPDIVAVGRATGNARIYWNKGK